MNTTNNWPFAFTALTPWRVFATLVGVLVPFAAGPACAQELVVERSSNTISVSQDAAPADRFHFAILPQPLMTALDAYNLITGRQIFYDSRLVIGVPSPGVSGNLSADEALSKLLNGTNLAPVKTIHGMISMAMRAQELRFAATPPISAATLSLDTIRVDAAPLDDHRSYATTVAYAIQGALQRNHQLHRSNYAIDMNVWLSTNGEVQNFVFLSSTTDDSLHDAIATVLRRVAVGRSPPRDLPQPVRIKIRASGAN